MSNLTQLGTTWAERLTVNAPFGLQTHNRSRVIFVTIILCVQFAAVAAYVTLNQMFTEDATIGQMTEMLDLAELGAINALDNYTEEVDRAAKTVVRLVEDVELEDSERSTAMFHALEYVPYLAGAYVADQDGGFVYVFRDGDRYGTKEIVPATGNSPRVVTFIDRDKSFVPFSLRVDPTDDYDPRVRPWFSLALTSAEPVAWTKPYTFFTSQKPGVTLAAAVGPASAPRVVGVDVELSQVVQFMEQLSEQASGEVFLFDDEGTALTRSGLLKADVEIVDPGDLADGADPELVAKAVSNARVRTAMSVLTQPDVDAVYESEGLVHLSRMRPVSFGGNWMIGLDIHEEAVIAPVLGAMSRQRVLAMVVGVLAGLLMAALFIPATRPIKRLEIDSRTDSLTSLPNRREILRRAESLVARDIPLSVAMLDLDHFKAINDQHGHDIGDQVLKRTTERLTRAGAEVGRLGGEEFLLLLRGETPEDDYAFLCRLLRDLAKDPIATTAGPVNVTASAGIATCKPGQLFTTALANADRALLSAKARGRNIAVAEWHTMEQSMLATVKL